MKHGRFVQANMGQCRLETSTGGGSGYLVQTPDGVLYNVYISVNSQDVVFRKSTDGIYWTAETIVGAATNVQLSVWYDRWSGIAAGKIHCAYVDSTADDVLYRSIDTESADALSTETVIFAGASTAGTTNSLSIARARGGNLGCFFDIDGGTEDGFAKSTDVGATWTGQPTTADPSEGAADYAILLPGWAADNQDFMMFFWDGSADEISRKLYDDSANTWSETSIATSMVDVAPSSCFPQFAATVDIANSRNLLVAWSARDLANADLRCWHITESAITEVTNVVLNSGDDQALAVIGIDTSTGYWYVFYTGASDGSETHTSSVNLYCKVSKDDGSTWGPETKLTHTPFDIRFLRNIPRFVGPIYVIFANNSTLSDMFWVTDITVPRLNFIMGLH
jgi:hypothetical protein